MMRVFMSLLAGCAVVSSVSAQSAPTYSKDIRPFLGKYCVECHNAKAMKGNLSLETYKEMMAGTDVKRIIKPGQPNASLLVLVCEGKEKPLMPPAKAKFRPTKDEVAMLRAWVAAGAQDDGAKCQDRAVGDQGEGECHPGNGHVLFGKKKQLRSRNNTCQLR